MQKFQRILAAVVVVAVTAVLGSAAEARHRHFSELTPGYACGPAVPPATLYIYPAANWRPFFRRHMYRFGPIVSCDPSTATNVISVRF